MPLPTTRELFKNLCLRQLGSPVIEINIDPDQVDDCVDMALVYYGDYHFDASDKQYYKYVIQPKNFPRNLAEVLVSNSGIGYSNTDVVNVFPSTNMISFGTNVIVPIVTDSFGSITSVPVDALYTSGPFSGVNNSGIGYQVDPVYTITTSTGSGAVLQPLHGGYITLPDNIIGVVNMFPLGQGTNTNNLFNIQYQIALNDLYTLSSVSMVPYYMAMTHIQSLEQMLVGQQPIRYNRRTNRCYLDMDWSRMNPGQFVILEAYQVIDPNIYTKVWSDRWLIRYATVLMKKMWGNNLKKFSGMQLPGGITMNGQKIYDEADKEQMMMEKEVNENFGPIVTDMIG